MMWRVPSVVMVSVALVGGPVIAQQSVEEQREERRAREADMLLADVIALCTEPEPHLIDPLAALDARGWLPVFPQHEEAVQLHAQHWNQSFWLTLGEASSPANHILEDQPTDYGEYDVSVSMISDRPPFDDVIDAVLTVGWRFRGDTAERICLLQTIARAPHVALFEAFANRAEAQEDVFAVSTPYMQALDNVVLAEDPLIDAGIYWMDADAYETATGRPPVADFFLELRTHAPRSAARPE